MKNLIGTIAGYSIITILGIFALLAIVGHFTGSAGASDIDCANLRTLDKPELKTCLDRSEQKEAEYKQQYQETASEVAHYRELVAAGEAELRSLNSLAESQRVKQRIMNRLLKSFPNRRQTEE